MAVCELGLSSEVSFEVVQARYPSTELLSRAPIGKIPVVFVSEGETVYESDLIARYLASLRDGQVLFPERFDLNFERTLALINGAMDAAAGVVMESWRAEEFQDIETSNRLKDRVNRILMELDRFLTATEWPGRYNDLALAAVLGYVDFREILPGWRQQFVNLSKWLDEISSTVWFESTKPI